MRKPIFALFTLGCLLFSANADLQAASKWNKSNNQDFSNVNSVVGTYISDIFQRPDPSTPGLFADRSMLITIHADGTIAAYNSQAYSRPNGRTEFNGIQYTPSLGAWEFFGCNAIKAVFLDYFSFAVNDVEGPNPNNFQVETSWNDGEYDRFASTIEFFNKVNGKYQEGSITLKLKGICHTCDPLDPNAGTPLYTVQNVHLRRVNVLPGYFN